ncbi:hypothetical protein BH11PSE12_BH11PSE12_33220 [soil metagenome]
MHDAVTYYGITALLILFMVVVCVRWYNAGATSVLIGSLVLIGVAVTQIFWLDSAGVIASLLLANGEISSKEEQLAKATITNWNIIIPLVVGGIGINMFSTWLTLAPKISTNNL